MRFFFSLMKYSGLLAPIVCSDWIFDSIFSCLGLILDIKTELLGLRPFLGVLFMVNLLIFNLLKPEFFLRKLIRIYLTLEYHQIFQVSTLDLFFFYLQEGVKIRVEKNLSKKNLVQKNLRSELSGLVHLNYFFSLSTEIG